MTIFGTTHTDANPSIYTTFREFVSGAVGTKNLASEGSANSYRVRLQLVNFDKKLVASLTKALPGWKTPGTTANTQRFSTVVTGKDAALAAAKQASAALYQFDTFVD